MPTAGSTSFEPRTVRLVPAVLSPRLLRRRPHPAALRRSVRAPARGAQPLPLLRRRPAGGRRRWPPRCARRSRRWPERVHLGRRRPDRCRPPTPRSPRCGRAPTRCCTPATCGPSSTSSRTTSRSSIPPAPPRRWSRRPTASGFPGIVNTPGLAEVYRSYGNPAVSFVPAVDLERYHPPTQPAGPAARRCGCSSTGDRRHRATRSGSGSPRSAR